MERFKAGLVLSIWLLSVSPLQGPGQPCLDLVADGFSDLSDYT